WIAGAGPRGAGVLKDSGKYAMNRIPMSGMVVRAAGVVACCLTMGALPSSLPPAAPSTLTLDAAVIWALQNNPEIAAIRQQHGIAAAAVVLAQTYPFNPLWQAKILVASGPESAAITNVIPNEQVVTIDLEVRGQPRLRRQGASAALSRTDFE